MCLGHTAPLAALCRNFLRMLYSKMNNFVHKACEGAVCWST